MEYLKSKFENQFSNVPEGGATAIIKNTIKMAYFRNNKLSAQNIFSVFITPWELHNVSSFNAKAIEHLVTLPRK